MQKSRADYSDTLETVIYSVSFRPQQTTLDRHGCKQTVVLIFEFLFYQGLILPGTVGFGENFAAECQRT